MLPWTCWPKFLWIAIVLKITCHPKSASPALAVSPHPCPDDPANWINPNFLPTHPQPFLSPRSSVLSEWGPSPGLQCWNSTHFWRTSSHTPSSKRHYSAPHPTSSLTKCDSCFLLISKVVGWNSKTVWQEKSPTTLRISWNMRVCIHTPHTQAHILTHRVRVDFVERLWTQVTFLPRSLPCNTDHHLSGAQVICKWDLFFCTASILKGKPCLA